MRRRHPRRRAGVAPLLLARVRDRAARRAHPQRRRRRGTCLRRRSSHDPGPHRRHRHRAAPRAGSERDGQSRAEQIRRSNAHRRATSTYTTWIYEAGAWESRRSLIADQPPNGFTVYSGEPEEQVDLLKRTYESGDTETRKLTRVFAEMSVVRRPKPAQ